MNEEHMRRAIALSFEQMQLGRGGPFGAVIVQGGTTIAEGCNEVTSGNDRQAAAAIGFDDEFLYREVPKPIAERTIPTSQMLKDEAHAGFAAWDAKPDKIAH